MVGAIQTFNNELEKINWNELFRNRTSEQCTSLFYNTIERLIDEMAPIRRLTKKESNLLKRPWITKGILISIKERNKIHKQYLKLKDKCKKEQIFEIYKKKKI